MLIILLYVSQFMTTEAIPKKKNFIKKDEYNYKKVKYFVLEKPFPKNTSIWENQTIQREFLLKSVDFANGDDYIFFFRSR